MFFKPIYFDRFLQELLVFTNTKEPEELAALLNIPVSTFMYELKQERLNYSWIIELAKRFDISTDWLFFSRTPGAQDHINPATMAALVQENNALKTENINLKEIIECQKLTIKMLRSATADPDDPMLKKNRHLQER